MKTFLAFIIYCTITFSFAQNSLPKLPFAEGCENAANKIECSEEKLRNIAFEALTASDMEKVISKTEKDTIFMHTKLYFNEDRTLSTENSTLKFHERELKFFEVELSFSLLDLPFAPNKEWTKKSAFGSYLFLKVDRENNKLIPLPAYQPERIPFSGPEKYIVFPGCESETTNKGLQKCMSTEINKIVAENFNTKLATKLNLSGIQRIFIVFTVNEEGKLSKIKVRAPHPGLKSEAIRIIQMLPTLKPAEIENTPISVRYTLPIVFSVN